jgi:hypothetical protein
LKNLETSTNSTTTAASTSTMSKSNSCEDDSKQFKLHSPYGDWCAFPGGGGSGGCVVTGPYEPIIVAKDDWSDESFESTEESDANIDLNGPVGIVKDAHFINMEVVWAKRPALPWFPGIVSIFLSKNSFARFRLILRLTIIHRCLSQVHSQAKR